MKRKLLKTRKSNLEWIQTLIYYDGPVVGLLVNTKKQMHVAVAVDSGESATSFLAAKISDAQLLDFENEKVDLRYLFERPHFKSWVRFEILYNLDSPIYGRPVKLEEIDRNEDFPSHGIFVRDTDFRKSTQVVSSVDREVKLDGAWTTRDFSNLTRRIEQIYAMNETLWWIKKDPVQARKSEGIKTFLNSLSNDWIHSSNYVSFYDSLKGANDNCELPVKSIQYASPGKIVFKAQPLAFESFTKQVKNFLENRKRITEEYSLLDKYLGEYKLREVSAKNFKIIEVENPIVSDTIFKYTTELATSLKIDNFDSVMELTKNRLVLAKVVLSFFRRTRDVAEFFVQGRTSF